MTSYFQQFQNLVKWGADSLQIPPWGGQRISIQTVRYSSLSITSQSCTSYQQGSAGTCKNCWTNPSYRNTKGLLFPGVAELNSSSKQVSIPQEVKHSLDWWRPIMIYGWSPLPPTDTNDICNHGFISVKMGVTHWCFNSTGQMVTSRDHPPDQLVGAQSSKKCLPLFSSAAYAKVYLSYYRQLGLHVLYQSAGRSEILFPLYRKNKIIELVHKTSQEFQQCISQQGKMSQWMLSRGVFIKTMNGSWIPHFLSAYLRLGNFQKWTSLPYQGTKNAICSIQREVGV